MRIRSNAVADDNLAGDRDGTKAAAVRSAHDFRIGDELNVGVAEAAVGDEGRHEAIATEGLDEHAFETIEPGATDDNAVLLTTRACVAAQELDVADEATFAEPIGLGLRDVQRRPFRHPAVQYRRVHPLADQLQAGAV